MSDIITNTDSKAKRSNTIWRESDYEQELENYVISLRLAAITDPESAGIYINRLKHIFTGKRSSEHTLKVCAFALWDIARNGRINSNLDLDNILEGVMEIIESPKVEDSTIEICFCVIGDIIIKDPNLVEEKYLKQSISGVEPDLFANRFRKMKLIAKNDKRITQKKRIKIINVFNTALHETSENLEMATEELDNGLKKPSCCMDYCTIC